MSMFAGKIGLVMGVANDRSIAWAMSESLLEQGAELAFTHLPGPSSERRVRELVDRRRPIEGGNSHETRPTDGKPDQVQNRSCDRCVSDRDIKRIVMPCDVQKDDEVARVCDAIRDVYGRLDFLIHSIAFAPPHELRKPYVEMSRAGWHLAMDISVYSLVATCRAAAPLMTEGGSIVTISYFGGEKVIPGYNVMGVCKAALEHSVRYLAWDLGRQNIRINCISAGPMRTLSAAGIAGFDELREHASQKSPLGRNVEPAELGATGLYLLGDLSQGVTGETIHVDCGYSIVGI